MKNIVVFCASGASTSLLVNKMKEAARNADYECTINAYGLHALKTEGAKADVILLGPQVKFRKNEVTSAFPEKPVYLIDMTLYGTMNGKAVLAKARELMND